MNDATHDQVSSLGQRILANSGPEESLIVASTEGDSKVLIAAIRLVHPSDGIELARQLLKQSLMMVDEQPDPDSPFNEQFEAARKAERLLDATRTSTDARDQDLNKRMN